jgi:DNA-binding LacI/PurR family transcriptional regulator
MPFVTIRDVAKRAGVGIGTVSRVLNNNPQVSVATRQRVEEAIRDLKFRPNRAARLLPSGTSHLNIGVLLPYLSYHPFVERLRGVQQALDAAEQANLVLYNVSAPDRIDELIDMITSQRNIDGLIVIAVNLTDAHIEALYSANITLVGIYDRALDAMPCISIDNVAGGFLATEYLIRLGHTRIAYIGDSFPNAWGFPTSEDRFNGYRQALHTHGQALNPDYVRLGEHGENIARQHARELLMLPEPPTAIFAMSDMQAFGALAAARELGCKTPEQISILGFDDLELSQYVGLSTVRQHLRESGFGGVQKLLYLLNDDPQAHQIGLPTPEVIQRVTTAAPS